MATVTHLETHFTEGDDALLGAVSVERFVWAGSVYLLVGGGALGVLTLYELEADALTEIDQIDVDAAFQMDGVSGFEVHESSNGAAEVFVFGSGSTAFATLQVDASGFTSTDVAPPASERPISDIAVIEDGDSAFYVHAGSDGSGLVVQDVRADGTLSEIDTVSDNSDLPLGDIAGVINLEVQGIEYVVAISAFDSGIAAFSIDANGNLTSTDEVAPSDGSGFWLPQDVVTLDLWGTDYVIMASSGTSSLTVYELDTAGQFFETDHVLDDSLTRFDDVDVLEAFTYADMGYVLAAGSDDGFTLLQLSPSGLLKPVVTVADAFETALQNISDLDADVSGDILTVSVVSDADHGVSLYELDLAATLYSPFDPVCDDFPFYTAPEANALGYVDEFVF